jgi:hypothetical protein
VRERLERDGPNGITGRLTCATKILMILASDKIDRYLGHLEKTDFGVGCSAELASEVQSPVGCHKYLNQLLVGTVLQGIKLASPKLGFSKRWQSWQNRYFP